MADQLATVLEAVRISYTAFACVGFALGVLSLHAARIDLRRVRLSGRNGYRLAMAQGNEREEQAHLLAQALIVAIGVNAVISPTPTITRNVYGSIFGGFCLIALAIVIGLDSTLSYITRRAVLERLDHEDLNRLQRLLEEDGLAYTETTEERPHADT